MERNTEEEDTGEPLIQTGEPQIQLDKASSTDTPFKLVPLTQNVKNNLWFLSLWYCVVVVTISVLIYSNQEALHGKYVYDDKATVQFHPIVTGVCVCVCIYMNIYTIYIYESNSVRNLSLY